MSSVTTPLASVPARDPDDVRRSVPSLEQLHEMTSQPDERIVIRDVDWAFYEQLVDSIPEGVNIHVDYDGKDLEIMSLSPLHDGVKKRLGRFVELTAEELEIPCTGSGSDDMEDAPSFPAALRLMTAIFSHQRSSRQWPRP